MFSFLRTRSTLSKAALSGAAGRHHSKHLASHVERATMFLAPSLLSMSHQDTLTVASHSGPNEYLGHHNAGGTGSRSPPTGQPGMDGWSHLTDTSLTVPPAHETICLFIHPFLKSHKTHIKTHLVTFTTFTMLYSYYQCLFPEHFYHSSVRTLPQE